MSDGHLIDSYPQTSLSLRQCCKAAVQQALKCCLFCSTNRTKYNVLYIECSVEMHNDIVWVLHMYSTQCQCAARKLKPGGSCFEDWSQKWDTPCSSLGSSDTVLDRRWFSRFASPLPPMLSLTVQGTAQFAQPVTQGRKQKAAQLEYRRASTPSSRVDGGGGQGGK